MRISPRSTNSSRNRLPELGKNAIIERVSLNRVRRPAARAMPTPIEIPWRDRTRLYRYGVALGVTALSLLARWPLWPILGNQTPHMTFFPAVMISAYFGGFGPGLLSTVLSALAAHYFLGEERFALQLGGLHDI